MNSSKNEPVELPINGTLDLHTFNPKELKNLVPDYLEACMDDNIYHARIIHGKGKGVQRRSVRAILKRLPYVESFGNGGIDSGGWGATLVTLRKNN